MREKVARAICWANCPNSMSEDDKRCQTEGAWDLWLPEADAVLAALEEPDSAMLEAGADNLFAAASDDWKDDALAVWTAMITAAREGGEGNV